MSTDRLTAPMIRALLEALTRAMYTSAGVVYQVSGTHGTIAALLRRDLVETAHREITLEDGTPDHQATAQWLTEAGCRHVRTMLEQVLARPVSNRPATYSEFLTEPRRSESIAAFLLHDARRIFTTDVSATGHIATGVINRQDGREQLGSALRAGHRITFAVAPNNPVTVHVRAGVRYTFAPILPGQAPDAVEQQPAQDTTAPSGRSHMRTVNGGTPERISTAQALDEINAAMIGDARTQVKEMSAAGSRAHIWYKDGRGKVALRPASHAESTTPDIPVSERHARGERVIVRHVSWDAHYRVHTVQSEFTATVVRYARNGNYVVREPEHGTTCEYPVRELRPAPPL